MEITLENVRNFARKSCKKCNGKGYLQFKPALTVAVKEIDYLNARCACVDKELKRRERRLDKQVEAPLANSPEKHEDVMDMFN